MRYSDEDITFYDHNIKRAMLGYEFDFRDCRTDVTHTQEFRNQNLAFIKEMAARGPCRVIQTHSYRVADNHVITLWDEEDKYNREYYIYEFGDEFPFAFEFPFKHLDLKIIVKKSWAYYAVEVSLGLIKPKLANKINNYKFDGNFSRYSGTKKKLGSVVRIDGFCGGSDVKPRMVTKTKPTFEYPYGLRVFNYSKKVIKELESCNVFIKHNSIENDILRLIGKEPHDWELIRGIHYYHIDNKEALNIFFTLLEEAKSNG